MGPCLGAVPGAVPGAWAVPWAVPGRAAGGERSWPERGPRVRRTALPVGPIIKMFFGEICANTARARAVGARVLA